MAHLVVDHLLEGGVVLAHHDGQRLDRDELAHHLELARIGRFGDQAVQLHVVHREAVGGLVHEHLHRLGVVGHRAHVDVDQAIAIGLVDCLERRGAGGGNEHMVLELRKLRDLAVGTHRETGSGDVVRDREGHLLAALRVVGGGAALEVGLAAGDRVDARGRADRQVVDHDRLQAQVLAHRLGDLLAEIQRVAHRLLVGVVVRERHRRFTMRQHDVSRGPDAVEDGMGLRVGSLGGRGFCLRPGLGGRCQAEDGNGRGQRGDYRQARPQRDGARGCAESAGGREKMHGRGLYAAPRSGANAIWRPHHASFAYGKRVIT